MAVNMLRLTTLKLLPKYNIATSANNIVSKCYYCTNKGDDDETSKRTGRFAEFYQKELELKDEISSGSKPATRETQTETFASMLRNSKFIDLGDPVGKEVIGEIYHVVGDDLYIDFGWKFPAVCTAPRQNTNFYVKGAKVRLQIKELELATKFLGAKEETTLLEADCLLLGLVRDRKTVKN